MAAKTVHQYKPEMHSDAFNYDNNCSMPMICAVQTLKYFFSKNPNFQFEGEVLDVGCGQGAVTSHLYSHFGPNVTFYACDISKDVMEYAKNNYPDTKASYFVFDACGTVPTDKKGKYDFIFSNFVLHWAMDHRTILQNFYAMLRDSGICLISFFSSHPLWESYRDLAMSLKWKNFMKDVEHFVTPYQDNSKPHVAFKRLLEGSGFRDIDVDLVELDYSEFTNGFDYESHKKLIRNIDPFLPRIPEELKESYMNDLMVRYIANEGFQNYDPETYNGGALKCGGVVIIAFGTK